MALGEVYNCFVLFKSFQFSFQLLAYSLTTVPKMVYFFYCGSQDGVYFLNVVP